MPGNLQHVPPPSVVASWPKPNYVDPVQRTWMPAYAGLLQAVTTLFLGTRLWLRARQKAGPLGLDDALLIPAYLCATMFTTLTIVSCQHYGMDRHVWDVPPSLFPRTALMAWLSELAFLISTCCTKVSVLLFYRRLVEGSYSPRWKAATIVAIIFTTMYCVSFVLVLVFNCQPTDAYWKSYSPTYQREYTCVNTQALNPLSGTLSVVSDLYSVLLPMGMLWNFDITWRKKIALFVVFSSGFLVVIAGALRTYYLTKLGRDYDITWLGFDVFIWAQLEIQLAITCASAPALRVFFRRYLSDPISRAIHTASSLSGAITSTNRDSRQPHPAGIVTYSEDNDVDSTAFRVTSNKTGLKESLRPSIEEVSTCSPSIAPPRLPAIKTADDFESFALDNLEKTRPAMRRWTLTRSKNGSDRSNSLSEPFGCKAIPKSWLDMDDKE